MINIYKLYDLIIKHLMYIEKALAVGVGNNSMKYYWLFVQIISSHGNLYNSDNS